MRARHPIAPAIAVVAAVAALAALALAACGRRPGAAASADELVFADESLGVRLLLPGGWAGRYTVERDTFTRLPALRIWLFQYHPRDAGIRPQTLLAVAVYDTASWRRVDAEEGPPQGEAVHAAGGRVVVVGWPQSNPFPPGADSATFDSLQFPHEQIARRLTLR